MTVGTHQSRRRAVMPRIQVLAVIKDDLGLWVCFNELGSKYRACRICHGNGVSDKRVKVVSCEGSAAVKGPKPSFPYQRTGLARDVINRTGYFSLLPTQLYPLRAIIRLLIDDIPPVESMVVSQCQESVLQRLCPGARHSYAQHLHGLGPLAWWRLAHGIDIVLEEAKEPVVYCKHRSFFCCVRSRQVVDSMSRKWMLRVIM